MSEQSYNPHFVIDYGRISSMYPAFTVKDWLIFSDYISKVIEEYLYDFDPDDIKEEQ